MLHNEPSRIHVTRAVVTFVVLEHGQDVGQEYELEFDFNTGEPDMAGSIYFGPDALRAQGFVDPHRVDQPTVEELYEILQDKEKHPSVSMRPTRPDAEAGSAPRVCWHEENSCRWYCPR